MIKYPLLNLHLARSVTWSCVYIHVTIVTTKKCGSGSKQDYAGFKQTVYRQSKSHSTTNKKEKNIHQSRLEKNAKADRGVDPLMNIEEGENNHTTSKVVHNL